MTILERWEKMKKAPYLAFLLLILFAFGSGCLPAPRRGYGTVEITANWGGTRLGRALSEIESVKATLTRESMTVTVSLTVGDGSATGSATGLYAGQWTVRVDAAMADGTIIYTGQSSVTAASNETRSVAVTLNATPGALDLSMNIAPLLAQGLTIPGGKVGIYKNPATNTATYYDLTVTGTTLHGVVANLPSRTYDAKVVIPQSSDAIFTSAYFQFSILPGRTTPVYLDADGWLAVDVQIVPEPGQVTGLSAVKDGTSVILAWSPVPGATGYRVYRTDGEGRFVQLKDPIAGGEVTTYIDTGFGSAPLYDGMVRYAVAALADAQEGIRSAPVEVAP